MNLTIKFNIALVFAMTTGAIVAGFFTYQLLQNNAREEVLEEARIMLQSAVAVRKYTVGEVRPLLNQQESPKFLKQTVPAYAARQYIETVRNKFPDYNYKEATLNPTNPVDKATDWETDIINYFRGRDDATELIGERDTATGRMLYLGVPIKITNQACLTCHSTPGAAPASMIEAYGTANGFGWQHNETVGAQIVSVPMSLPLGRANQTFIVFFLALSGVFVGIIVVINFMLYKMVIRRVKRLANKANEVSMGSLEAEELKIKGKDEISSLGHSFNRMHRSLNNAMTMLEEED